MFDFLAGAVPLVLSHGVNCSLHHCENKTTNLFCNPEYFESDLTVCGCYQFDSFTVVAVCDDCLDMLVKDSLDVFKKFSEVFERPTQYNLE